MSEITDLSLNELRAALDNREVNPVEVAKAYIHRIQESDERVKAFITVTEDIALEQAAKAERMIEEGNSGPLTGIPIGIKDVICTKGVPTTCSSRMLEGFKPPYDATVMEKLNGQGAVMVGKLNMDEFAMGSSTENSAFFPTHNPWDLDRVPGGSSGGSAAAVAARECVVSLGSDTGGSIRQPAAFCGVVGLKPTYGRVSRYGLVAFASSLDQIGPFARNIKDCALTFQAISGHDHRDSTSAPMPEEDFVSACTPKIEGLTVGVPAEYFVEGMSNEVEETVRQAINRFRDAGATIKEISLPHSRHALAAYYIIATAEASSNLSRYDGVKYGFRAEEYSNLMEMYRATRSQGFGPEVKRRIMLGTYCLSAGYYDAFYKKASSVRALIIQDFKNAFDECDIIAAPVTPTTAFRIGEKAQDPIQMYLSDIFTIPVNLAGVPGISMPCGFDSKGLPIGIQLIAKHFQEKILFQAAHTLETVLDLQIKWPELKTKS